jgi:hypothetical protein
MPPTADSVLPASKTLYDPGRPLVVRAFNGVGRGLEGLGCSLSLDEQRLCDRAIRRAGSADFGDERFRLGLRRQLAAYTDDAKLSPLGRLVARTNILRCLTNRLRIEDRIKRNPQILDCPLPRPLVILQNYLAQDPASRSLRLWEALDPAGSRPDGRERENRRLRNAARLVWLASIVAPKLRELHLPQADDAEECLWLFQNTFLGPALGQKNLFEFAMSVPQEIIDWSYGEYRRQLQLLQWQRPAPGHWLLKSCTHLLMLDALAKTLPEACIVQIHRDPSRVMPSFCQVLSQINAVFYDDDRWKDVGPDLLKLVAGGLERAVAVRKSLPAKRFFDVHFRDVVADPIGVARRIYEHFGYAWSEGLEQSMKAFQASHPKPERSKNYYDLEQFGLKQSDVENAFAAYYEHHGIQPERRGD